MSDSASETTGSNGSEYDSVTELVEENPDEVARVLERLGLVNDLLDTAELATAAMDDRMVRELSGTASNLGAVADGFATPEAAALGESAGENADELAEAIETVARLQRTGALDDLVALADVASLATAAMDDEMVTELASTGSTLVEVADTAADEDVARTLQSLLQAVGEAGSDPPEPVGAIDLLRSIRDPEVKQGLGVMLSVARATGRNMQDDHIEE